MNETAPVQLREMQLSINVIRISDISRLICIIKLYISIIIAFIGPVVHSTASCDPRLSTLTYECGLQLGGLVVQCFIEHILYVL